jgi:hypothetical protein
MHTLFLALVTATLALAQGAQPPPSKPDGDRPPIRIPENLPPPAGEELRVKADDIDAFLKKENAILLDVREPWELEKLGTRPGYVNIPLAELEKRMTELPKDKTILTA